MIVLHLLAGCATEPVEAPTQAGALDDPAFRFCHVPGGNAADAKAWCALLPDLPEEDRCPGLRATCEDNVVAVDPVSGCGPDGTAVPGEVADAPVPPPPPPTEWSCAPSEMGRFEGLLRWVAAIAVAVIVLLLARVFWATFGRGRRHTTRSRTDRAVVTRVDSQEEDVPPEPPEDLLSAARRALADGHPGEAVRLARAAALRRLGDRGHLTLHRARTDREYLAALRAEAALQGWLRVLVNAHAAFRWGRQEVNAATAEMALAAAERIVVAGLIFVALCLPAHAATPTVERYAPDGDAALLRVFERHGWSAGWRLRGLSGIDHTTDVLVLDLSEVVLESEHWAAVRTWVEEGGILIVAGDASDGFPGLGPRLEAPPDHSIVVAEWLEGSLATPVLPGGPQWGFGGGGEEWASIAGADLRFLLVRDVGLGVVLALSDPRVLDNGAWVDPDNEAFIGELLTVGRDVGGLPLAGPDTGDSTGPARIQLATAAAVAAPAAPAVDPFGALEKARLLPLVLQLLASWTVFALWLGWPFGRLKDAREEGRHAFVEHVQALGTRYYRLRASDHAARALSALWVARLGPGGLEWAAMRAGYRTDEARAFAARVAAAAASDGRRSADAGDLTHMEELWRITRGSS